MTDLQDCPVCSGSANNLCYAGTIGPVMDTRVYCACGFSGPWMATHEAAKEAWNDLAHEIKRPPAPRGMVIPANFDEVEALSFGLSNIACWLRGFHAARPDDDYVIGASSVTRANELLKAAMRDATAKRGASE